MRKARLHWWSLATAVLGVSLLTSCITDATRYVDVPAGNPGAQNGSLGNCPVFPADNAWNRDVSTLPVDTGSAQYLNGIAALGGNQKLHADFGGGGLYGIPYITVPGNQATVPVTFVDYGDESDPGPYPVPLSAPIEGDSARHVLAVDRDHCKLYEMLAASPQADHWDASSGAVFDLRSNALRPEGWTSADAAGLRSSPGWCGTTRWRAGTSIMRCGSPSRARNAASSTRPRTSRRRPRIRRCHPWAFGSG